MKPIDSFSAAMLRARHLLILYDLVHDSRSRKIRSDWGSSFKELMRWPKTESIVRVDGKDKNSLLVLRESLGIDRSHFSYGYSSELLRAAVVATVSAIDRYMHDIVVYHCWNLLSLPEDKIPSQLLKLSIRVIDAKKATENCRRDQNSRPGHIFKKAIQQHLHEEFTFQKPDDLVKAAKMLGIEDFWGKVSQKFQVNHTKQDLIDKLRVISRRRNQIVHEADLILKTKAKKLTLREINSDEALDWVDWMDELGQVIDKVIAGAIYKPRVK